MDLNALKIFLMLIIYIFAALVWWKLFEYYALDIILTIENRQDIYYFQTYYKKYSIAKNDIILIKDSFFEENVIINLILVMERYIEKYLENILDLIKSIISILI